MTWEIALVGVYSTISFSFIFASTGFLRKDNEGESGSILLGKYLRIILFLIGIGLLVLLPTQMKQIIDAQTMDANIATTIKDNLDSVYGILLKLTIALFWVAIILFIWDIVRTLIEKRHQKDVKEEQFGDFT